MDAYFWILVNYIYCYNVGLTNVDDYAMFKFAYIFVWLHQTWFSNIIEDL